MRKDGFLQKLEAALRFLFQKNAHIRIMTCGKCGSTNIKSIAQKPISLEYKENGRCIDLYWSDFNQCLQCGAVCEEIQMWNFEGKPELVNPNVFKNSKK